VTTRNTIPKLKLVTHFFNKLKVGLQKRSKMIPFVFSPVVLKMVQELAAKHYFHGYYIQDNLIYSFPKYLSIFSSKSIKPALLEFKIGSTSRNMQFFNNATIQRLVIMNPNATYIFETRLGFFTADDLVHQKIGGKLIFYFV
jgi:ribosomal protein S8